MLVSGILEAGDSMEIAIKRTIAFFAVLYSAAVFCGGTALAIDAPHVDADGITCNSCHTLHGAPGTSLTKSASNANLCQSCHNQGSGNPKPMENVMQATPGVSGTSHRWDASMPATSSPSNAFGLRAAADLSISALKSALTKYGNVISCSVCHNHHGQAATPWDPNAPAYVAGGGAGRHYQRYPNNLNQMCEDCHYYRAMSYARARGDDAAYPANGTNVFSHPVGETINSQGYDKAAPLDYNGVAQQTAPRYSDNAAGETVTSNNLALDSGSRVRCLSCHRVHYVDSNGATEDAP